MSEVSKLNINGISYDIKDAVARNRILPAGGDTGRVLKKKSNSDYDVEWAIDAGANVSTIPDGGTIGQVLAKKSNADGDVDWYSIGHLPVEKWYLPTGITENDVVAAFQFVKRPSMDYALTNVNEGEEYILIPTSDVTWNVDTGFLIPGKDGSGLYNDAIIDLKSGLVKSAAFGFKHYYSGTSNTTIGGIMISPTRTIQIRGRTNNAYVNRPSINRSGESTYGFKTYDDFYYDGTNNFRSGVLYGEWPEYDFQSSLYPDSQLYYYDSYGGHASSYSDGLMLEQFGGNNSLYVTPNVIGNNNASTNDNSKFNVTAVVFYYNELSVSQSFELCENIEALGGI